MSTIVTRAGKGSPLTNTEVDSNFTNLNTDKYQDGGALGTPASGTLTNCTGLPQSGVASLTTDLALKAPLASPTFTGVPLAPTAAVDTNTTQLATTAFVIGQSYLKSATAASTYVALTGDQTISGTKTFTNTNSIVGSTGTGGYGAFYATGSGTNNAYLFLANATNGERCRLWSQDDRALRFSNNGGTTTHLTLDSSGNLTAAANVTAYSDERLKENIQLIPDALAKVESVRGVIYTWKESGLPGTGVIAQEIQKIAPEAVLASEDGTLSVAYGNLVGLLIEAVKDLSGQVKELKAKVGN